MHYWVRHGIFSIQHKHLIFYIKLCYNQKDKSPADTDRVTIFITIIFMAAPFIINLINSGAAGRS